MHAMLRQICSPAAACQQASQQKVPQLVMLLLITGIMLIIGDAADAAGQIRKGIHDQLHLLIIF